MNKAKKLNLEDLQVGLTSSFEVHLTQKMIDTFLHLSGDFNPLHSDETYAAGTKFKKIVVPGMLLASFFSRMVGMYIPGEKSLYISQNLLFKHPAYIGDTVVVQGTVTKVLAALRIVTLSTVITHATSKKILVEGEGRALLL